MTRKELTNRCREIRDNNKWKTLNEDDFNFLMTEIFPYHEKWEEKKGCGVITHNAKDILNTQSGSEA